MTAVFTALPMATYIVVANPATYKAVRSVAGNWVASADGLPTTAGLVLHALVFVIIVSILMKLFLPSKSGYAISMAPLDDGEVTPMYMAEGPGPAPAPSPAEDVIQTLINKFKY